MKRSLPAFLSAGCACAALLLAQPASAQLNRLPQLGAPAPDSLLTSGKHEKVCRTGPGHRDPCAAVVIGKIRYTIAWDAQTKDITYLFTDDHHLVTDSGLAVGSTCRVAGASGQPDDSFRYMKWLIDPRWKGQDSSLGVDATWYAVLHQDGLDPHYGDVIGFLQSSYLKVAK